MNSWPSIAKPDFPLEEERSFPVIRSEFDNGAVQTRLRFSKKRLIATLRWEAMTETDYGTLETFFDANQGLTFTWTHPVTSASYTVRFRDDSLKSSAISYTRRQVTVVLEEA
ncbi:MAG: hypothetical protein LLG20_01925 [Acidobacteriales bacterium]|nr:hypothetical protein [Terriglobales bacterium]